MTTTEKTKQYVLETYGRFPLTVARGKGTRVWDERGREYLDFCSGIATCSLGHCHPALTKAIAEQSTTLMHCSNLYYIGQQADLAELIVERVVGHPGKIFFSNSGAEANDGLIKFARRFGQATGRYELITFNKSFHGRTIGAMTATAQAKIHEGFDPLPTGFTYVEPNNLDAVKAALTDKTAAFLLEPIQGEGGVNPMTREFLEGLSGLAKEKDILLLLDEVQCGFGRTGDLNGYDTIASGLAPDGISWAKGMGGGFPIGSFYVAERHAHLLGPGSHGSTYGGNALACAASKAVIETIIAENLTENVKAREAQIRETIAGWNHPAITEVRGHGLLLGIGLKPDTLDIPEGKAASIHLCAALIEKGLLVPPAGPEIVRLLPPLNVSADEVDQALQLVKAAFDDHLKS
ncbi:acetylornithine/succinylornithine family transaminase [Akkermansiaceae bacterium]|nr:acetylornithine/succinylornithine family transaminase [Akkermansiaceae bacterium]MDB4383826.1 acetylornithine/succinylornithine family transaminase [Akkermansiaceae bacterium]